MIDLSLVLEGKRQFALGDVFKSPFSDCQLFVVTDEFWSNFHSGIYLANEMTEYHKTKILNGEFGINHLFLSAHNLRFMSVTGLCNNDLVQVQGVTYKVTDYSQLYFWCRRDLGESSLDDMFIRDFEQWAEKVDQSHILAQISLDDYDADDELSTTSLSDAQSLDSESRSTGALRAIKGFFKSVFRR